MNSNHSAQDSKAHKKVGSTSSFFKPQQSPDEDKKELIEKIAREVCDQIHQEGYHYYTNPPGTNVSTTHNSISFSPPENYDKALATQKMLLLREYTYAAHQNLWREYEQAFPNLRNQYSLSEEMRSLATTYFNDLRELCYFRICSAYFEVFGGGNCGEISAH